MRSKDVTNGMSDRRKRARLALSLTVYVFRPASGMPVVSKTVNISSGGFYCTTLDPFMPGEQVRCVIILPSCDYEQPEEHLSLEGHSTVLRIDTLDTGSYGIACRLDSYKVVPHVVNASSSEFARLLFAE